MLPNKVWPVTENFGIRASRHPGSALFREGRRFAKLALVRQDSPKF
jgi:hypothetical protein